MSEEILSNKEEEITTEGSPPQSQVDELLAQMERAELLREEESLGDTQGQEVYLEDREETEQPASLNPEDYRNQLIEKFGRADLEVKYGPARMGRFDAKNGKLFHLITRDGQREEEDVAELMKSSNVPEEERVNLGRRLDELARDGVSFDKNGSEVIVHIVDGPNYYTFAFSSQPELPKELAFLTEDGEVAPSIFPENSPDANAQVIPAPVVEAMNVAPVAEVAESEGEYIVNDLSAASGAGRKDREIPVSARETLDTSPSLKAEGGAADLPKLKPIIATPDAFSDRRVRVFLRQEPPSPQRAEPLPDPTSESKRQPESTAPPQSAELITEDVFEGISLIIERPLMGGSGALLAEVEDLLPERVVDIHPSLGGGEHSAVGPSLWPSEGPEQSGSKDAEIIDMPAPEQKGGETFSPVYQLKESGITAEVEMEQPGVKIIEIQEDSEDIVSQYLTKETVSAALAEIPAVIRYEAGSETEIVVSAEEELTLAIELEEVLPEFIDETLSKETLILRDSSIVDFVQNKPESVEPLNPVLTRTETEGIKIEEGNNATGVESAAAQIAEPAGAVEVPSRPALKTQREVEDASPHKNIAVQETAPPKPKTANFHYLGSTPAKTESGLNQSGKANSPVPEQRTPRLRFVNFAKNPVASLRPPESTNNFIPFKPTAIVSDEEETGNDTINIYEPEFELAA